MSKSTQAHTESEAQRQRRERDEELSRVPLFKPNKSKWPVYTRSISIDELEFVGVDKEGRLYWDGELIKLERRITLGSWELFWLAMAALGAALSGLVDVLGFFSIDLL